MYANIDSIGFGKIPTALQSAMRYTNKIPIGLASAYMGSKFVCCIMNGLRLKCTAITKVFELGYPNICSRRWCSGHNILFAAPNLYG